MRQDRYWHLAVQSGEVSKEIGQERVAATLREKFDEAVRIRWQPGEQPKPTQARKGNTGRANCRNAMRRASRFRQELSLSLPTEAWKKVA